VFDAESKEEHEAVKAGDGSSASFLEAKEPSPFFLFFVEIYRMRPGFGDFF
jgi:hypothetical protein